MLIKNYVQILVIRHYTQYVFIIFKHAVCNNYSVIPEVYYLCFDFIHFQSHTRKKTHSINIVEHPHFHQLKPYEVHIVKCIHGLVAIDLSSLVPQSRELCHGHSMSFIPIIDTTNYINYSFLLRTIDQWNCLPDHIATSTSLDTFKKGVCGLVHV